MKSPEAPQVDPSHALNLIFYLTCLHISAQTFLFFRLFFFCFSHSLIPATSRLRINYISIDRPLGRGIDIHGPPSAARPMCIPQHRSPQASCITPGSHYLLCFSLSSRCLFGRKEEVPRRPGISFTHRMRTGGVFTHEQTPCV